MTHLEILDAQIARARSYFREKTHRQYLSSAMEIIEASAHCGQGTTLNDNQTRALALFLESQTAIREVNALQKCQNTAAPTNILRFSQN